MLEKLPHYLLCPECDNKHFLTVNRDAFGQWTGGYIEFEGRTACCFVNGAENLHELAIRLRAAVGRYERRIERDTDEGGTEIWI